MSSHDDEILGKEYDSRLMRRLMTYLRPYRGRAVLALLAIVAGVAAQLAQPVLVKRAIDDYIATGDLGGLTTVALLYLGTLVGAFVAEFVQMTTLQMVGQRIMYDLRRQVYDHLQRLDVAYYDRNPVGRLMTRVTSDVDAINDLFTSGVVSVFGDVLSLAGIIVVLVTLDWRLALLTFCVLPLILIVTQWFRTHVRQSYREVRTWVSRLNAFLQEHLTGIGTVQLFRREAAAVGEFDRVNREHRDANLRSIYYYAVFYPAIELIGAMSTALILWFGGGWVLAGTVTIGTLVAFIQYAQRFFRPISDMSEKFNLLQAAMASSERLFALLDTPVTVKDAGTGDRVPGTESVAAVTARRPTASTSATCRSPACVRTSRWCCRTSTCSRARWPATSGSAEPTSTTSGCGRRPVPSMPTRSFAHCRRATTRRSPSVAPRCRWGRSSCCRSRGPSPSTRRSWCSTRPPPASTPRPRS